MSTRGAIAHPVAVGERRPGDEEHEMRSPGGYHATLRRMNGDLDVPLERILVIAIDRLGDTLQACPTMQALRLQFIGARIDLLAIENYGPALEGSPFHDRYLGLSAEDITAYGVSAESLLAGGSVTSDGLSELIDVLRNEHYDLIVNLVTSTLGAWLTTVANPRFNVGLYVAQDRSLLVEGRSLCYFVALLDFRDENPFNLVDIFRASVASPAGTYLPETYVNKVESLFPAGRDLVALNPGASQADRRWPLSSFAALADALLAEGLRVFLVGSDADAALCEAVCRHTVSKPVVYTGMTVQEMAGWFQGLGCIVSNDTGAMHVAAATGVKAVGMYGGFSRYRETAPFSEGNLLLECAEVADVDVRSVVEAVLVQLGRREESTALAHWQNVGVEVARTRLHADRPEALGGLAYDVLTERASAPTGTDFSPEEIDGDAARHKLIRALARASFERLWIGKPLTESDLQSALVPFGASDVRADLNEGLERWAVALENMGDRWISCGKTEEVTDGQVAVLLKVEGMNVSQIIGDGANMPAKLLEWDLRMIPFTDLDSFVAARAAKLRSAASLARSWAKALATEA